jgi:hypothetical protein
MNEEVWISERAKSRFVIENSPVVEDFVTRIRVTDFFVEEVE